MKVVVLIPAYNPDEKLLDTLKTQHDAGFDSFVLVDDGSRPDCEPIFRKASAFPGVSIVRHSINCGKGRALKTGFNTILQLYPDTVGVISCDADGQHPIEAMIAVSKAMEEHPDSLVLGVREFLKGKNVPLPNLVGNMITRFVFKLVTGIYFKDTQCGLRGFPISVVKQMITVEGERFDYENKMLLAVRERRIPVVQIPMEAVYIGNNETSHFDRVQDSLRIYKTILGFAVLPIIGALVSFLLYFYLRDLFTPFYGPWISYAIGLAAGYLFLLFSLPRKKVIPGILLFTLLGSIAVTCMAALHIAHLYPTGIWFILAIPLGAMNYCVWLNLRYGNKPQNIY
ncbi:MAG: glycosyltransferase family 2 protein [Christensenellales bacterium]|jgi:glycosyltransferase involved in cell wall biosynthesis